MTQQAWGQFTDDQELEICLEVLKRHPGEEEGTIQRYMRWCLLSGPTGRLEQSSGILALSHPPRPCAEPSRPWTGWVGLARPV